MILSLVSNNDLSHFDGFRFQEAVDGNKVPESEERYGGKAHNGRFDMHRRDTVVRYVSRFSAVNERATHRHAVVIENDGRRKQGVALGDSGGGVSTEHDILVLFFEVTILHSKLKSIHATLLLNNRWIWGDHYYEL